MDDASERSGDAGERLRPRPRPTDAPAARLALLGTFRLVVDGEERRVASRKARLMLARLALADGAGVSREALTALFWEDRAPEQARGSLRTCLAELRRALAPHGDLVRGGEGALSLDVDRVAVDALDLVALASGPSAEQALPLLAGDLLQSEPGVEREVEHWLETERRRVRHLVLGVLDAVLDRVVEERRHSRAAELALRALALEPLREGLHRKLMRIYDLMGEPARALRQFRLLQDLLRAELDVAPEPETLALYHRIRAERRAPPEGAVPAPLSVHGAEPVRQAVRFACAADRVRLAYAVSGEGTPVVKAANWMTHLERERDSPVWRHWIEALTARWRLVRHDQRSNGLSDWDVADLSFEAMVGDLEAVVDAAGLDRFVLLGVSQGCAISVAFAARHPERVRGLVLYGGYARGWRARADPHEVARRARARHADPRGLGPGRAGVPPGLHLALHPRREPRADGLVQRAPAHLGLARERRAPVGRVRRHRRGRAPGGASRADAGAAREGRPRVPLLRRAASWPLPSPARSSWPWRAPTTSCSTASPPSSGSWRRWRASWTASTAPRPGASPPEAPRPPAPAD